MDITIKANKRDGTWIAKTFIGDKKEDILTDMQKYIEDNKHHYIDIFFSNPEEAQQFTYDELFNP